MEIQNDIIYFAKTRSTAIIPSKKTEDAGYDFFPNFIKKYIIIAPGELKIIPTGIATAFNSNYVLIISRSLRRAEVINNRCV